MKTATGATMHDTRAVSEVISFLLLFAVLIGVSITGAVFGIESLEEASEGDDIHAAEGAMGAVRADLYDLSNGAVYRTTEIKLHSGALRYGNSINITITASTGGESELVHSVRPQPIVYDLGPVDVVYVAGAVLLDQPDGGTVKTGPSLKIGSEQAIVPLVNTSYAAGPTGIGGSGIGYVVGYRSDETVRRYEPLDADGNPVEATITIEVETPRTKQWRLYFDSSPNFENVVVDETRVTVFAEFRTQRLFIKSTNVEVRFDV